VVEGVNQRQGLIEEALRLQAGGMDGMMQMAEALEERGRLGRSRRVVALAWRGRNRRRQNEAKKQGSLGHEDPRGLANRHSSLVTASVSLHS
jgi:hypothetical protein